MLGFSSILNLFLLVWREFSEFEWIFRLISCLWSTIVSDALPTFPSPNYYLVTKAAQRTKVLFVVRVTGNLSFQNKNTIELWDQSFWTQSSAAWNSADSKLIHYRLLCSMGIINILADSHLNWIPLQIQFWKNQSMKRLNRFQSLN